MTIKQHHRFKEKLLEKLAELEHEQWSHIIWYLNKEHMLSLGKWMSAYYLTLIKKPYSELSEAKKESDREWARKVLKIVDKYCVSKQEIRKLTEDLEKKLEGRVYADGIHEEDEDVKIMMEIKKRLLSALGKASKAQ